VADPIFRNVGWTVGSHCNAHCAHCYSRGVREGAARFLDEMEMDRIIAQLAALGVRTVNLGGNEPIYTHGPDPRQSRLPRLLGKLAAAGLPVGLTTNGVTFRELRQHHPEALAWLNDVDFSLDWPAREEHDAARGAPLFDLVVDSIRRCGELGLPCSITVCATRENFTAPTIAGFLDLAGRLGCELRVNMLKPVEPYLLARMPTRDQFYAGFAQLMAATDCLTQAEGCLTAFTASGAAGCPCGLRSFRINGKTAAGTVPVGPCIYAHAFRDGDLLTQDLADIVAGPEFMRFTRRARELPRACREVDCPHLETCRGGCTARTWFVHGSLDAKDPYCPLDHLADHGARPPLPVAPPVGLADTLRVHDDYLCTWIGRPRRAEGGASSGGGR
jgi:radical SAM protein with 4Fe4S-binding SPASM domain